MEKRLYPPNIEGTIPAFTKEGASWKIEVPFSMNKTVATNQIYRMILKVRAVNTNSVLTTIQTSEFTNSKAIFTTSYDFVPGQYYKIQMAYIDKVAQQAGYYSSIGVIKCTTMPQVYIEGLEAGEININIHSYIGVYAQIDSNNTVTNMDTNEKMYSCRFTLRDAHGTVIKDSGEILHSTNKDILSYQSYEEFLVDEDLVEGEKYYLRFTVQTTNGLIVSSPAYRIIQSKTVDCPLVADLIAAQDFENGTIELSLKAPNLFDVASGNFLISRCSNKNNWGWEKLQYFTLKSENPTKYLMTDFTVEQGVTYKYCVQQWNASGIYSNRIESQEVYADFEDAFLYDGKRQLRIRFNPKVSSFKNTILENKVDTIGSKYPFITRNGYVNYKDFPISGLISYQMDNDELFMPMSDLDVDFNVYDLVSENISSERKFKLAVLDWLTNGKAKMFRSPAEGNYIVRLMNVSLAPTDTLGRMLHTFNSNAYEIAPFNYDSLNFYGFINLKEEVNTVVKWASIDLSEMANTADYDYQAFNNRRPINTDVAAYSVKIENAIPGSVFFINGRQFTINATGNLYYSSDTPIGTLAVEDKEVVSITPSEYEPNKYFIIDDSGLYTVDSSPTFGSEKTYYYFKSYRGILTYSYHSATDTEFTAINKIVHKEIPCHQILGDYYKYPAPGMWDGTHNIFDLIHNSYHQIGGIDYIRLEKREIIPIFVPEELFLYQSPITEQTSFYSNEFCLLADKINLKPDEGEGVDLIPGIYEICYGKSHNYAIGRNLDNTLSYIYNGEKAKENTMMPDTYPVSTGFYLSVNSCGGLPQAFWRIMILPYSEDIYTATVNGQDISLAYGLNKSYTSKDNITSIDINDGVVAYIGYQQNIVAYEMNNRQIKDEYDALVDAQAQHNAAKVGKNYNGTEVVNSTENTLLRLMQAEYAYTKKLDIELAKLKGEIGQ